MIIQNQHCKHPRFRLLGLAVLILLGCEIITACDWTDFLPSNQATVPESTQKYSKLGVTVQLPGTGWNMSPPSNLEPGLDEGELAISPDKLLVFSVERRSMSVSEIYVNLFLETYADSYHSAMYEDTSPAEKTWTVFHGNRALRIEGVRGSRLMPDGSYLSPELTEDYRFIQYFFAVRTQVYIVGTGVKLSEWNEENKALVKSILNSVTLP